MKFGYNIFSVSHTCLSETFKKIIVVFLVKNISFLSLFNQRHILTHHSNGSFTVVRKILVAVERVA